MQSDKKPINHRSSRKKATDELNKLLDNAPFRAELEEIRALPFDLKRETEALKLAVKYRIDYSQLSPLFQWLNSPVPPPLPKEIQEIDGAEFFRINLDLKMQAIKRYGKQHYNMNISEDSSVMQAQKTVYPISISIHKDASLPDLVSFLSEHWKKDIKPFLKDDSAINTRLMPLRRKEEDAFLWKNKDIPHKELLELLIQKFGQKNELLTETDIDKRLSVIRRRKEKPLR